MAELHEIRQREELLGSLKKAIEDGKKEEALRRQHKIQKVAKVLREKNNDCFEPIVVSIGPYHHKKPHLQPMEKHKARMLGEYLEALHCPMEWLYHEVEKVAAKARECYAEDATNGMKNDEFTRMMFVDGCFFLHFIRPGRRMEMTRNDRVWVNRDLFLLENQLPFIVLKALSPLSDPVNLMMRFINNWPHHHLKEKKPTAGTMVFDCRLWCHPQRKKEQSNAEREKQQSKTEGEPIHLLQLLHQSLLNPEDHKLKQKQSGMSCGWSCGWHCCWSCTCNYRGGRRGEGGGFGLHTYRSATELKKVGIRFRRSQSHRFTDVGFRKNLGLLRIQGVLRLPPMSVGHHTKSRLLNLVAYEMCADVPEEVSDVTSYVCFLDALIDSTEDVMELRSQGILINHLGSDHQLAQLFNKIAEDLIPDAKAYGRVNEQIEKHYKNKFKRWVLERMYTHFKAPWSRLSFVAALIILLLTFIQAFYAVKAFYAPKNG